MGSHSLWAHVRARLALARRGAAAALVLHGSRVGAEWELSGSGEQQREAPTRFRRQAGCCALRERPAFGPRLDPKRGSSDGCGHGTELSRSHGRPGRSRPRPARESVRDRAAGATTPVGSIRGLGPNRVKQVKSNLCVWSRRGRDPKVRLEVLGRIAGLSQITLLCLVAPRASHDRGKTFKPLGVITLEGHGVRSRHETP